MINYVALFTALVISGVTAYFSILGLTAIFSGSWYSILVMGTSLEVGKVVTATWLHINWHNRDIPKSIKAYLTIATAVLMVITSMGVFGFLSKAHVDQQVKLTTGVAQEVQLLDLQIEASRKLIKDLDGRITQYDNEIKDGAKKLIEQGKVKSSQNVTANPRKERDRLDKERQEEQRKIATLEAAKVKHGAELRRVEAEVGPIKYVANLLFSDEPNSDHLERAVRWMIVILVIVFDPLAISLLLGSTHGFGRKEEPEPDEPEEAEEEVVVELPKRRGRPPKLVEINESMIFKKVPEKED